MIKTYHGRNTFIVNATLGLINRRALMGLIHLFLIVGVCPLIGINRNVKKYCWATGGVLLVVCCIYMYQQKKKKDLLRKQQLQEENEAQQKNKEKTIYAYLHGRLENKDFSSGIKEIISNTVTMFLNNLPDSSLNINKVIEKDSSLENYLKKNYVNITFFDNGDVINYGAFSELIIGEVYLFCKHMKLYKNIDYLRMPIIEKTKKEKEILNELISFDKEFFDYIQNHDKKNKIILSLSPEDEAWVQKLRTIGGFAQK